ncbi:MAG: HlyD family efflux transporter periplasmic adaptor subunit [Gemmatimonadota bacterium]|nr:HlyD family efflux transporter periplasmic adaptor subunit [Gemmatimonadota bacterium]
MTARHRLIIVAIAVVVMAVTLLVLSLRSAGTPDIIEASGTVEATEADLGFQTPGRVDRIVVQEGDAVEQDQELAWLDRRELSAAKRVAEAQVDAARARLAELQRGFRPEEVAQGRAAVQAATRRLDDARRDVERTRRLHAGGAVSDHQLENAESAVTVVESEYESVIEQLQILERGPRSEQIAAQRGVLAQAEATVGRADAALEYAVVQAPFAGTVTIRHREPGETVPAGMPVVTLMNPDSRWIRIYVSETQVGRLALGLPATISADAYEDRTYDGRITFIADEAEFTPRNVQTTEERVKLVYRVKVQILGDPSFDLKPGLPADVRIDTSSR